LIIWASSGKRSVVVERNTSSFTMF